MPGARQTAYLQAMGIDVWRANASPDLADGAGDIVHVGVAAGLDV